MSQNGSRRAAGAATDSVGIIKADATENTRQADTAQSRTKLAAVWPPTAEVAHAAGHERQSPKNRIDLTGKRFGRWTVLVRAGSREQRAYWLCRCVCGKERTVAGVVLRRGSSKSCGCLRRESLRAAKFKHGHSRRNRKPSRVYTCWLTMRQRCCNPNGAAYDYYGGRGIRVCERWSKFENFLADMGEPPAGKSIDRIDVNGHYEPSNCQWSTPLEQAHNRRPRSSKRKGRRATLAEIQAYAATLARAASALGGGAP